MKNAIMGGEPLVAQKTVLEEVVEEVVEEIIINDNRYNLSTGRYSEDIEQIHREFAIAGETLLEEAMKALDANKDINLSKLERLTSLGFKNAQEVEPLTKIKETVELSEETINLVKHYKKHYPFNNFITEEQVKEICHKYNLVHGTNDRYKGFVPEKNIREIENFKVREEDTNFLKAIELHSKGGYYVPNGTIYTLENAEIRTRGGYSHIFLKNDVSKYPHHAFQKQASDEWFYASDSYNLFGLNHIESARLIIKDPNESLTICAPVKDMDISGLELIEGYKLQRKIEIPDPVVLREVRGGYLIVTAWGDEANDPLVMNINNQ